MTQWAVASVAVPAAMEDGTEDDRAEDVPNSSRC